MPINEPHFVATAIAGVMDMGSDGFAIRMTNPDRETLLLVCPLVLIRGFIANLSTAAHLAEKHQGAENAGGAIPIQKASIDANPSTGAVSIALHLEGGAAIPLTVPPEFARTIAAALLEEAAKLPGSALQ